MLVLEFSVKPERNPHMQTAMLSYLSVMGGGGGTFHDFPSINFYF